MAFDLRSTPLAADAKPSRHFSLRLRCFYICSGAVIIIQRNRPALAASTGPVRAIKTASYVRSSRAEWAGMNRRRKMARNKEVKAWADRWTSSGLCRFDFGQTNVCVSKCFFYGGAD